MLSRPRPSVIQIMANVRRHARSKGAGRSPAYVPVFRPLSGRQALGVRRQPGRRHAGLQRSAAGRRAVKHLPLFFDLLGRRVVVVGEGPAADRRAALARSAGAEVRQLPDVRIDDLRGAAAVFIATGDLEHDTVAQRVAKSLGVPVNVADRPALCDFILPAIVDRDDVVVAISTGGASPTLAASLRGRIEAVLPERIGNLAKLAATFRAQVNALIVDPARRRTFWRRLVEGPAARLVLAGDDAGARRTALGELDDAPRRLAAAGAKLPTPPPGSRRWASPISSAQVRAPPIS